MTVLEELRGISTFVSEVKYFYVLLALNPLAFSHFQILTIWVYEWSAELAHTNVVFVFGIVVVRFSRVIFLTLYDAAIANL